MCDLWVHSPRQQHHFPIPVPYPTPPHTDLRHTACEVDATEVLRAGDHVPERWPISWHKLDYVGGQAGLPEDAVDGIASQHGGVTGLPQDHVALPKRCERGSQGSGIPTTPTMSPTAPHLIARSPLPGTTTPHVPPT